jgi:type II secretory pathway component GspD/PulD (secretin)
MFENLVPLLGVLMAIPAPFAQAAQEERGVPAPAIQEAPPAAEARQATVEAVEKVKEEDAEERKPIPAARKPLPPQPARVTARPSVAKPDKRVRKVCRVRHVPAQDLANVVHGVLRSESQTGNGPAGRAQAVAIVPDSITNSLIISAAPQVFEEIIDMVEILDHRPATVQVRALIAEFSTEEADPALLDELATSAADKSIDELAAKLQKLPGLRLLGRPQVTVLDNQAGFLQLGERVPRITGSQVSPVGRTNTVVMDNVGLILGVTTRTNSEGLVTMEIDVEKSHVGPEEEGIPVSVPKDGDPIRTPRIETLTLQTTVSARSDQTIVLGGLRGRSENRETQLILLVSPRIVQP